MTTYVYDTLNETSQGFTDASINDHGQVAGDIYNGTTYDGFVYSNGSYTAITYPMSTSTQVFAINDSGELVGTAVVSGTATGFSYSGGTFASAAPADPSYASAINKTGLIAGSYYTGSLYKIFIYDGTTYYSGISPSDNQSSNSNPSNEFAVDSINNSGQISGFYNNGSTTVGFVYTYTGTNYLSGTFSTIADPNGNTINATFINDSGLIAGQYDNTTTGYQTGFLDKNGTYTDIAPTGATQTRVSGINNAGQVVGDYTTDGSHFYGFIYNSTSNTYTTLIDQGSPLTEPAFINNEGQVVGYFAGSNDQLFVATPMPTVAINAIDGNNVINSAEAAAGVTISGTETNVDGQTVTVKILNNSNAVVDSYTTTAASGAWSVSVTKAQAQALADGGYTVTANASDEFGNAATQATQAVTVHEAAPTIAANTIPLVTTTQAASGFTISGTESGADSRTVTVQILDSSGNVVATDTGTATAGSWSVNVTAGQAQALSVDSVYEVTANVSDQYGNAASQAVTPLMTLPATPANAAALDIFSVQNDPVAINDSGQLAATTDGNVTFGVLYSNGTYANISPPGAGAQQFYTVRAESINATGEVAGWYFPAGSTNQVGFIDNNGTYTTIAPPGAIFTEPTSINNAGQVVGYYNGVAFLYSNGSYTTLTAPAGEHFSSAVKLLINNPGQIAGSYTGNFSTFTGFVYSGGQYTTISPAGSTSTQVQSINGSGEVAGYYSNGTTTVGFIDNNGTYTTIFDPKGTATYVEAINNAGQVAGYYYNGTINVGFVYSNGTYTDIPLAGSTANYVYSINNSNQVGGYFYNGTIYTAFIASFVPATRPTIAINPVEGDNLITVAEAAAGVTISGTESGADGQTVTVDFLNSSSTVVDSLTATAANGAWSTSLTAAQAQALADGSYTVTANVSDQNGNAATQTSETVSVLPSRGGNNDEWLLYNGQWAVSAQPGSHPSGSNVAGIGDWTGNRTDGILWFNPTTGDTDEWQLSGGAWSGSVDLGSHPGNFQISGVGDFNGDGTSDVLWTNTSGGSVQTDIWELSSSGNWMASVSPGSHPAGYTVAGTGDWTGNGTDGILWHNASTGDTDEWQLSGGQWSASVDLGSHPGNFQIAGIGDFNGDGTSDVLWTGTNADGTIATDIWELSSTGQWMASVSPGSHPAGYQVAGVCDFTGTGTSDILWYNPSTGGTDEWLINNGQWAGSISLGSHPGNFQIAGAGDFNGAGNAGVLWHSSS